MKTTLWPVAAALVLAIAAPAAGDPYTGPDFSGPGTRGAAAPARNADDRLDAPFLPGERHDETVPAPEAFLGYPLGARFTPHHRIVDYCRALAARSPRARWDEYGTTYEGRPLGTLTLASAENMGRLDAIRADNARLFDAGRTSRAEAEKIAARAPIIVWLSYSVHGDEGSSSETAMQVAYELAAGASAGSLLDSAIVIIDPCLNPDGRDRYVDGFARSTGRKPDANPAAWEHDEPWPGGRYNHYLFDLNRDWAWRTQRETRAREAAYLAWRPQVHVDFHEMSYNASYFFFPAAEPFNVNLPPQVRAWGERFGRGNAEAFDRNGWPFYTAEEFDLYYPGYGDSWPTLQGSTGMTYEQAGHGRAGLEVTRRDGTVLTLRERIRHHFVASLATIRTAGRFRVERLLDYYTFFAEGITAPLDGPAAYLIPPGRDPGRSAELVNLLRDHGITVERTLETLKGAAARDYEGAPVHHDFPKGTWIVPVRQPLRGLVNALLEPEAALPETLFYDITAWSLPVAFGVEAYTMDREPAGRFDPESRAEAPQGGVAGDGPAVAWLLPWTENAAPRLLARLLDAGVRASFATKTFESGGRSFDRGTVVVTRSANGDSIATVLDRLARAEGVTVYPAPSSWTGDGIDLGSGRMVPIRTPRTAVVCGAGVGPTSFGAVWFLLDRQYGIPVTLLPLSALAGADLSAFNVLVFPDDEDGDGSGYENALDSLAVDRLSRWVRAGGVLTALRGGAAWATRDRSGLTGIRLRPDAGAEDADADAADDAEAEIARKLAPIEQREKENRLKRIPGAILRVVLDPAHPLAYGYDGATRIIKTGTTLFEPGDPGTNVGYYPRSPRVSGYISPENEERLAETPFLVAEGRGRGTVILYNEDPNFRVFWYGLNRLFLNSLFFAGGF